ncbi:MAG: PEP-CTERM sorting domain-containing protein [Phormidium sp. BM_Day4_Bin.17]|nr:PEP-CTERM sorting domain-containing protein [Phormidium sp. BM_Day4_Bin.17]UCJ12042.1 MAG: PEP-CTERM sorting domain-containing protein [Phormidium sp. PBR-2020]
MTLRYSLSLATLSLSLTGLSMLIPSQAEAITFDEGGSFGGTINLEVDGTVAETSELRFEEEEDAGIYQDPSDYGEFDISSADGVFSPYDGESALIQSIDFDDVDDGVSEFLEFQGDDGLPSWSLDLNDDIDITPNPDSPIPGLRMVASATLQGQDEASGYFSLSTEGDGRTEASFTSDVAVPEPTGLLGLGVVAGVMAGLRRWTKPEESG